MTFPDTEKFWLHVPFEMTGGNLSKSTGKSLFLLGHRVTLKAEPGTGEDPNMPSTWRHWLLFDPMTDADARALVGSLRAKMSSFSAFAGAKIDVVFTLPVSGIFSATAGGDSRAVYNGPLITLIPADKVPSPVWGRFHMSVDYSETLLAELDDSPEVSDERLLSTLELWKIASYETLPRTKFLTYLTILDSLAVAPDRDQVVVKWLNEKIVEAQAFPGAGIHGGLENLKRMSHTAAIKALVRRAANKQGLSEKEVKEREKRASTLYSQRSKLSHQGKAASFDFSEARDLVASVLRAAIEAPAILEVEEPAKVNVKRRCRQRRVARRRKLEIRRRGSGEVSDQRSHRG